MLFLGFPTSNIKIVIGAPLSVHMRRAGFIQSLGTSDREGPSQGFGLRNALHASYAILLNKFDFFLPKRIRFGVGMQFLRKPDPLDLEPRSQAVRVPEADADADRSIVFLDIDINSLYKLDFICAQCRLPNIVGD